MAQLSKYFKINILLNDEINNENIENLDFIGYGDIILFFDFGTKTNLENFYLAAEDEDISVGIFTKKNNTITINGIRSLFNNYNSQNFNNFLSNNEKIIFYLPNDLKNSLNDKNYFKLEKNFFELVFSNTFNYSSFDFLSPNLPNPDFLNEFFLNSIFIPKEEILQNERIKFYEFFDSDFQIGNPENLFHGDRKFLNIDLNRELLSNFNFEENINLNFNQNTNIIPISLKISSFNSNISNTKKNFFKLNDGIFFKNNTNLLLIDNIINNINLKYILIYYEKIDLNLLYEKIKNKELFFEKITYDEFNFLYITDALLTNKKINYLLFKNNY